MLQVVGTVVDKRFDETNTRLNPGAHILRSKVPIAQGAPCTSMKHLKGAQYRVGSWVLHCICHPECPFRACTQTAVLAPPVGTGEGTQQRV